MIFNKHPELYSILFPIVAVPIMLFITFLFMGLEVSVKPVDDCITPNMGMTNPCP